MRVLLRLLAQCSTSCATCPIRDVRGFPERSTADAMSLIAAERRAGADELVFLRGEVTAREDLTQLVEHASTLGYGIVQLQTDARRLSYARYTRALAHAGATHVEVLLYAADAATHDAIARLPGAFDQTWQGLQRAVAEGMSVQVQVPMARPALATLPALAPALAEVGVGRLQLALPRPIPTEDGACSSHVPTLAEASLTLRRVLEAAAGRVLVQSEALPLCVVGAGTGPGPGPETALASDYDPTRASVIIHDLHRTVRDLSSLRPEYRPWSPRCAGCTVRQECPTTWGAWLGLHGDQELRPFDARS